VALRGWRTDRIASAASHDRPGRLHGVAPNSHDDVVEVYDDADVVRDDPYELAHDRAPAGAREIEYAVLLGHAPHSDLRMPADHAEAVGAVRAHWFAAERL